MLTEIWRTTFYGLAVIHFSTTTYILSRFAKFMGKRFWLSICNTNIRTIYDWKNWYIFSETRGSIVESALSISRAHWLTRAPLRRYVRGGTVVSVVEAAAVHHSLLLDTVDTIGPRRTGRGHKVVKSQWPWQWWWSLEKSQGFMEDLLTTIKISQPESRRTHWSKIPN